MNKIKKTAVCAALCMVMVLGSSLTSLAASGSTYSYSNLNLTWSTSASSASATLRSGSKAWLSVTVQGDAYSGNIKRGSFIKGSGTVSGYSVSVSAPRYGTTKIKNGIAEGLRNYSQWIGTSIYY